VKKNKNISSRELGLQLLDWYDTNRRVLPWRTNTPDPYHVWLSEIMLQQTTVATVIPYFGNFMALWPKVEDLAHSDLDRILHAWQGLGYYARARNLHKCAKVVTDQLGGQFPDSEAELLKLPGIGPYTAGAIAAIAFNRPSTPVDGNIERVISRLHTLDKPTKTIKPRIAELSGEMMPHERPGDFVQAMMDLGATVCRPKSVNCPSCPWTEGCQACANGTWEQFPVKMPKKPKPIRHGIGFWLVRDDGAIYLRRRPEKGLLGGMTEIPSTDWREQPWTPAEIVDFAPTQSEWREVPGEITHTFTHFHLHLSLVVGAAKPNDLGNGIWCLPDQFPDHALPTVIKKLVRHGLRSVNAE